MSQASHAMRVHAPGGPEAMRWEEVEIGAPGPGQALIRHTAVGVNYVDVYQRSGVYDMPMPMTPGNEGAGVVEAVGPGVESLRPGDRVAYAMALGAYAERRLVAADRLVRLPDAVDERSAAAMMLKGMTAAYLLKRSFKAGTGHRILLHAAAGGVGLILGQWAAALGATVIGTVGSKEKAALALAHGCAHAIDYREEDFVARVREITGGEGVDVVYDSVGKDTFPASLDCLKPLGLWVTFGQSSGRLPPLDTQLLAQKGSLFAHRPTLASFVSRPAELHALAAELFAVVAAGTVRIPIHQDFPLREAAAAHRALEGRQTTGATVLIP